MFWFKAYPNISINDQPAGELRNGTYIVSEVPPGTHLLVVHQNEFWAIPDMATELRLRTLICIDLVQSFLSFFIKCILIKHLEKDNSGYQRR